MYKLTQINKQFSIVEIQSNKLFKMRYNLLEAKKQACKTVVTFGGAFSNHIAATATFGKQQGFNTIGIIRGQELGVDLAKTLKSNPTLQKAAQKGMHFEFVTREVYKTKHHKDFMQRFGDSYKKHYIIPEGGTNTLAVKGCEEILNKQTASFDTICIPVGTGGTISGIINTAEKHQKVLGFPALKGDFLIPEISKYAKKTNNWELNKEYHFGGFAKVSDELITFINDFNKQHDVMLDPIYNAKMVFGILDLIKKGFLKNQKIVAINTGGLQGIQGVNQRLKKKNKTQIYV